MTSAAVDDMVSDGQGFVATDKVNGRLSSHGESLVGCFHPYKGVKIKTEDGVTTSDTHKMVSRVIN